MKSTKNIKRVTEIEELASSAEHFIGDLPKVLLEAHEGIKGYIFSETTRLQTKWGRNKEIETTLQEKQKEFEAVILNIADIDLYFKEGILKSKTEDLDIINQMAQEIRKENRRLSHSLMDAHSYTINKISVLQHSGAIMDVLEGSLKELKSIESRYRNITRGISRLFSSDREVLKGKWGAKITKIEELRYPNWPFTDYLGNVLFNTYNNIQNRINTIIIELGVERGERGYLQGKKEGVKSAVLKKYLQGKKEELKTAILNIANIDLCLGGRNVKSKAEDRLLYINKRLTEEVENAVEVLEMTSNHKRPYEAIYRIDECLKSFSSIERHYSGQIKRRGTTATHWWSAKVFTSYFSAIAMPKVTSAWDAGKAFVALGLRQASITCDTLKPAVLLCRRRAGLKNKQIDKSL